MDRDRFRKGQVVRVIAHPKNPRCEFVGRLAIVNSWSLAGGLLSLSFEDRERYCSPDIVELVEPLIAETYRAQRNCPF